MVSVDLRPNKPILLFTLPGLLPKLPTKEKDLIS